MKKADMVIPACRGCIYLAPMYGGTLGGGFGCGYSAYTGKLKGARQDPCPFKDTNPAHRPSSSTEESEAYW